MKLIDEFRDRHLCDILLDQIHKESAEEISIMEVCGGHTMALRRFGIPSLLPENIRLLSGPGCPVCVTGRGYIDNAISLSHKENTTVCTHGDLVRVPGNSGNLDQARASGGSVQVVYSPLQCLEMAAGNPGRHFVFLGIGFETTAPGSAVALKRAFDEDVLNFHLYSAHKVMPPAMAAIIHAGVKVDSYLCPGHVSAVTGSAMYEALVHDYDVGCVIAGFEPVDLLQAVLMLLRQQSGGKRMVEIQYTRAVKPEGNLRARQFIEEVFEAGDAWWRGLGLLHDSGLYIREKYRRHDAEFKFELPLSEPEDPPGCRCGEVLKGLVKPDECVLFAIKCTPADPVGACMVSAEGACQTWYNYAPGN